MKSRSWGGKRSGAGRKPKAPDASGIGDAKQFLEKVVRGEIVPGPAQLDAAKALLPYQHRKLGETGKKEQKQEEAGKVAGRFAPSAPPRLVTSGGKRIE